jgi:hypothetical protein
MGMADVMTKRRARSGRPRGARHTLMLPPPEECRLHSPSWVRGAHESSYFDSDPVTLLQALEEAPRSCYVSMVEAHVDVLAGWLAIGDDVIANLAWDAPERRGVGWSLLMFAAELAGALGSELHDLGISEDVVVRANEVIALATLRAGACLGHLASDYWASVA